VTTPISHEQSTPRAEPIGGSDHSPTTTVSNINFTVAESGGDEGGWQRVSDSLAAWLVNEWEREQAASLGKQVGPTT
jgi:hypothetical protein